MMKYLHKITAVSLMGLIALFATGLTVQAQTDSGSQSADAQIIESADEAQGSEFVTINVKDANIAEVLKAYSLQTGQSIVVGPDVVSDNVNVRLNNIPWQNALDVILKPYGFGYRVVGDTIVISKLENIVTVEGIEPLASQVFELKYLDAYDIKDVCEAQLTGRGKFTILSTKGLPGWEFGGKGATGRATSSAGVRERAKKEQIQKSKTVVITDVPASLTAIADIIEELDKMPGQILIEARFLEVDMDNLSDIGLEFITAIENVVGPVLGESAVGLVDGGGNVLNPVEALTDPIDAGAQGMFNQNNGVRLTSSSLGDTGFDMLFKLQQKDEDINILSAPRILTLDNQEAAMLVGQKYPIIESDVTGGTIANTSISLDYYENIGIQLNVLPQISDGEFINMVVHPVVSEIAGFTDGSVELVATDISSSTRYPIMNVREAETQILLKTKETAVIGGLQTQRDSFEVQKVPFIGDIPFIGRLFRREIKTVQTIDLLIFIQATIIDRETYVAESMVLKKEQEAAMTLVNEVNEEVAEEAAEATAEESAEEATEEAAAAEEVPVEPAGEAAPAGEPAAELSEEELARSQAENQEILALVKSMDDTDTNVVDTVEL
jgi:type II secretory pathway component GspD/PulD (secretin)